VNHIQRIQAHLGEDATDPAYSNAMTLRLIVDLDVPPVTWCLDHDDLRKAVKRACEHSLDLISEGVTVKACEFAKEQPIPF